MVPMVCAHGPPARAGGGRGRQALQRGAVLFVEAFMEGAYIKHSNNYGSVCRDELGDGSGPSRLILPSFSVLARA